MQKVILQIDVAPKSGLAKKKVHNFVHFNFAIIVYFHSIIYNEHLALAELIRRVKERTAVEQLVVFGSVARGDATEESDLDVLIVTEELISYSDENTIFDITYFVNMEYDTNISVVVVPKEKWESEVWSLLPLHQAIAREGIAV